jgi:hypothetical protein
MSDKDNQAGDLWDHVISTELEATNFGIVCLTPGNLESPWIHFEAGGISKTVTSQARVGPLLHDLNTADVGLPLSRFQMKQLDQRGVFDTVSSMNSILDQDRRLDKQDLSNVFRDLWPRLKEELDKVSPNEPSDKRKDREILEELLELVRSSASSSLSSKVSHPAHLSEDGGLFMSTTSHEDVPDDLRDVVYELSDLAGDSGMVTYSGRLIKVQLSRKKEELSHRELYDLLMVENSILR